jgi:hypothetical protein
MTLRGLFQTGFLQHYNMAFVTAVQTAVGVAVRRAVGTAVSTAVCASNWQNDVL